MQPTSQIIVITLGGRYAGQPLMALETFSGGVTDLVLFDTEGNAVSATPVESVAEVLAYTRKLRHIGQDHPDVFATLNITRGHATLVA